MSTLLNDVLDLSGKIVNNNSDEQMVDLTEFGEKLTKSDDIEFLWIAKYASGAASNATNSIKTFSQDRIADNVSEKGSIRLGNEVFLYSKSSVWKTSDVKRLIKWLVTEASNNESLIDDIVALVGKNFIPKLLGLDAVAKKRGRDPKVIRDTFLYKDWKKKSDLKMINAMSKHAPKWVHELSHGERKK